MQRVSRASAVASLPSPPAGGTPGFFTGGNPALGQAATVPGYEWFNSVQEELLAVILRGGITASGADLAQMRKSLDRLFAGGISNLFANTTLTIDNAGIVFVDAAASARVITLPAANALAGLPVRFQIQKSDGSANSVTIQRAGTDLIEGGTSVTIAAQHQSVTLVSNGVDRWATLPGLPASTARSGVSRFATAAETDAGTLADVAVTPAGLGVAARSFAANGYVRIPGGGIIQWGAGNTTASPPNTFSFPVAFPNQCLQILSSDGGSGAGSFGIAPLSASQFQIWGRDVTLTGAPFASRAFRYFAIGF